MSLELGSGGGLSKKHFLPDPIMRQEKLGILDGRCKGVSAAADWRDNTRKLSQIKVRHSNTMDNLVFISSDIVCYKKKCSRFIY